MRALRVVPLPAVIAAAIAAMPMACGSGAPARSAAASAFRGVGVGASADPTVQHARLFPEAVDDTQGYGNEPGGGLRAITAGLRVVTARDGSISIAEERLPQAPQLTTALPERLGGGFLFVLGTTVWRADHWLETARPIFASFQSIQAIVPGLDRVYVRAQNAYLAIDGKTGAVLDLGPWPASPFVSGFAAADGWRAAAVTDLRGVVATYDAGATWRALDLPMEPRQVLVSGDSLAVGGIENGKSEAWFEVRADGTIARLSGAPREAKGKLLSAPTPTRPYYPGGYPGGGGVIVPMPFPVAPGATAVPSVRSTATALAGAEGSREESVQDAGTRIFGKRPLVAAIEDGWPLTDGTAVVARDGALARVRLSDGALTEMVQGAFPLKPARCHPVSLTRANAIGAFGFVCGEPRGASAIYAYDPSRGRLAELKRFDRPRVVTSSGNGALAVRGPCAEDGDPSATPREPVRIEPKLDAGADDGGVAEGKSDGGKNDRAARAERAEREKAEREAAAKAEREAAAKAATPEVHPYCVLGHDNAWREVHVRGDVGGERVIVLADGKIAVVSPPQSQSGPARLTLLDKGRATTLPIVFPSVTADIARVLRLGVWLDGFEERKPGVVGGWIEAGGAMLGVEIALDGKATPGQFVRDAGMPFVSGRYGFGWTPSRRGFETTDGGMTWKSLELPEPLVPVGKVERRACGPIGCLAAGWLRVGWGETKKPPIPPAPPPHRAATSISPPQLALACEPTLPTMPTPPAPKPKPMALTPQPSSTPRRTFGGPPVLASTGAAGVTDLPAFFAQPGPPLRDSERGMPFEVPELPRAELAAPRRPRARLRLGPEGRRLGHAGQVAGEVAVAVRRMERGARVRAHGSSADPARFHEAVVRVRQLLPGVFELLLDRGRRRPVARDARRPSLDAHGHDAHRARGRSRSGRDPSRRRRALRRDRRRHACRGSLVHRHASSGGGELSGHDDLAGRRRGRTRARARLAGGGRVGAADGRAARTSLRRSRDRSRRRRATHRRALDRDALGASDRSRDRAAR